MIHGIHMKETDSVWSVVIRFLRHRKIQIACVLAFILNLSDIFSPLHRIPSVLFCCIVAAWAYTVSERVLHERIRFYLIFGAYALASLFLIRECRWVFFESIPKLSNLLIYAYYIPIILVPVCVLGVSLCIDRPKEMKGDRYIWSFWVMAAVLVSIILTNERHHLFLVIDGDGHIDHRLVYYIIVLYEVILVSVSFLITMRRCTLSVVKDRWYIPVSAAGVGMLLLFIYFIVGGSPTVAGRKLYHIHEVYSLLFIGFLEGCIKIGLIPSNMGYADYFEVADAEAWIEDSDRNLIYETGKNRERDELSTESRVQIKEMTIHGGSTHWVEDLTHIYELREEIKEAIESLSEENTLIRYENEIKSRNAEISARKHLYESIAAVTQPQVDELKRCIELAETDKANERKWISVGSVICACIKRRSNLELMGFEKDHISIQELYVSVNEVNDYLSKCGYKAALKISGVETAPATVLQHAFSIIEQEVMSTINGSGSPSDRSWTEDGWEFLLSVQKKGDGEYGES